jgi:hypothetical protein
MRSAALLPTFLLLALAGCTGDRQDIIEASGTV